MAKMQTEKERERERDRDRERAFAHSARLLVAPGPVIVPLK